MCFCTDLAADDGFLNVRIRKSDTIFSFLDRVHRRENGGLTDSIAAGDTIPGVQAGYFMLCQRYPDAQGGRFTAEAFRRRFSQFCEAKDGNWNAQARTCYSSDNSALFYASVFDETEISSEPASLLNACMPAGAGADGWRLLRFQIVAPSTDSLNARVAFEERVLFEQLNPSSNYNDFLTRKSAFDERQRERSHLDALAAQERVSAQLVRERPLKIRRGARVCRVDGGYRFVGFTEDYAPETDKIKISVVAAFSTGAYERQVATEQQQIWGLVDQWQLCE
jgi:hypothetical protein